MSIHTREPSKISNGHVVAYISRGTRYASAAALGQRHCRIGVDRAADRCLTGCRAVGPHRTGIGCRIPRDAIVPRRAVSTVTHLRGACRRREGSVGTGRDEYSACSAVVPQRTQVSYRDAGVQSGRYRRTVPTHAIVSGSAGAGFYAICTVLAQRTGHAVVSPLQSDHH